MKNSNTSEACLSQIIQVIVSVPFWQTAPGKSECVPVTCFCFVVYLSLVVFADNCMVSRIVSQLFTLCVCVCVCVCCVCGVYFVCVYWEECWCLMTDLHMFIVCFDVCFLLLLFWTCVWNVCTWTYLRRGALRPHYYCYYYYCYLMTCVWNRCRRNECVVCFEVTVCGWLNAVTLSLFRGDCVRLTECCNPIIVSRWPCAVDWML